MADDAIISVEHLSKKYRLGKIGATTLRESAERLWHRLRGRDPAEEMGVVGRRTLNVERKEKNVERRTLNVESRDTATSTESPSRSTSHVLPPTSTVDDLWTLKDVGFEVRRGEVLGVIGRNGADFSEVERFIGTPVKNYSSEMYVGLAFAVNAALTLRPFCGNVTLENDDTTRWSVGVSGREGRLWRCNSRFLIRW